MKKLVLVLILGLAVFLLAACQSAASPQPAETATPVPPTATQAAPTSTAIPATPTGETSQNEAPPAGCTVVTRSIIPTGESPFPAVTKDDWQLGPSDAPITIIEYSDFQCPYCAQTAPILRQLQRDYPEDVRLVFRHFPLVSIHDKARLGVQAADAAGAQGEFWAMHDVLFGKQNEWAGLPADAFQSWLMKEAEEMGLDTEKFAADLTSPDSEALSQKAWDDGIALGLKGTPTLVINGQFYDGPRDLWSLSAIVKLVKLENEQFKQCPEMAIDPAKQYFATLQTEKGDIVVQLYADKSPLAVNNFVFLAQQGWYDGVTFHRVIPGFVAQAGDPTGTGLGGPGYAFANETDNGLSFDEAGVVGMANAGPNTNGSQFFITYAPQPQLDGGYTVFGKVVSGMDVVKALTPRDPAQNPNLPPGDRILDIVIEEK